MANSTTLYSLPDGRKAVDVSEAKTLAIKDCGVVQNVTVDGLTITLPATVVGYDYTIRNGGVKITSGPIRSGADGTILITVSPNSNDMFVGMELTGANDKDMTNTKATSKVGDELSILGDGAAASGWVIKRVVGTWAKEA